MAPNVLDSTGFHPLISRWFRQRFAHPSPPQQRGWPSIAAAKHTLILAPTGSGKTLAAFLWSIDRLFRQSLNVESHQFAQNPWGIHTLYISPLKALNNDIHHNLKVPLKEIQLLAEAVELLEKVSRTHPSGLYLLRSALCSMRSAHKPAPPSPHLVTRTPHPLSRNPYPATRLPHCLSKKCKAFGISADTLD